MVDTGGAQRHPADTARLFTYWAHGAGAAVIQPEAEGAFHRCEVAVQEAVTKHGAPLPDHVLKGFCARVIHEATGQWPGAHGSNHGHKA